MGKFAGIIFDFNGTIFLDSPYHEEAWLEYAASALGRRLTREEYLRNVHGASNTMICKYLYGRFLPPAENARIAAEKEALYRAICLKNRASLRLSPGFEELIGRLNRAGIPHALASSSERQNMDFFRELFPLAAWFGENVAYDDGTIRGKPEPDLFLRASEKLGIPMEKLIVAEDANSGMIAARRAGAGMVIALAPEGAENCVGAEHADLVIRDFTAFPADLLEEDAAARIRRITHFEEILDRATRLAETASPAALEAAMPEIEELEAYYTGAEWKADFAADEAGMLPKDLKRGVLSEDAVNDLLDRIRELKQS